MYRPVTSFGLRYRPLLLAGAMLLIGLSHALELTEQVITREEWPLHPNSIEIGTLSQVREILAGFDEKMGFHIVVRYPGGLEGSRWADELLAWFVSHGVPSAYLRKEPGTEMPDTLLLLLASGH